MATEAVCDESVSNSARDGSLLRYDDYTIRAYYDDSSSPSLLMIEMLERFSRSHEGVNVIPLKYRIDMMEDASQRDVSYQTESARAVPALMIFKRDEKSEKRLVTYKAGSMKGANLIHMIFDYGKFEKELESHMGAETTKAPYQTARTE